MARTSTRMRHPKRAASPLAGLKEQLKAEEPVIERPDIRDEVREDDPRSRAARRTAELLKHGSYVGANVDKFAIRPETIPVDWTYEWKAISVWNQAQSTYEVELRANGWEPVPADRHPELMPPNNRDQFIVREGLMLMERPSEITRMARDMELREAVAQKRMPHEQAGELPKGSAPRDNNGQSLVKLNRSYEFLRGVDPGV